MGVEKQESHALNNTLCGCVRGRAKLKIPVTLISRRAPQRRRRGWQKTQPRARVLEVRRRERSRATCVGALEKGETARKTSRTEHPVESRESGVGKVSSLFFSRATKTRETRRNRRQLFEPQRSTGNFTTIAFGGARLFIHAFLQSRQSLLSLTFLKLWVPSSKTSTTKMSDLSYVSTHISRHLSIRFYVCFTNKKLVLPIIHLLERVPGRPVDELDRNALDGFR